LGDCAIHYSKIVMTEGEPHKLWKSVACGCGNGVHLERLLDVGDGGRKGRIDCVDEANGDCAEVQFDRRRLPWDIAKLLAAKSAGLCENPKLVVAEKDYDYASSLAAGTGIQVLPATAMNLLEAVAYCMRTKAERVDRPGVPGGNPPAGAQGD